MTMPRLTRRIILKKLAYATPTILTLIATPTFAGRGSGTSKWIERDAQRWAPRRTN